jgi:PAS domain S-box-containing protein
VLVSASGQVIGVASMALDITDRKRAEEALQASETRLRAFVESNVIGIQFGDVDGRVYDCNREMERIIGRSREEVLAGKVSWVDIPPPEDLPLDEAARAQALESGHCKPYEKRYLRPDGTLVPVQVGYVLLEPGRRKSVAFILDITERKRAEEALRENEQRLVSIYNTVRDVIFHLAVEPDGQFRFVSVNAAFLSVTGLSLERVVGKTVNEVIPEPSLTMVLGKYRQAVEEKTLVVWEETSDYATGRLTGEVSVAPVFDNNGNCTHLVGSVHDVTERNRAEETLRRSLDEIAHMNRVASMGELTASIAHEINQPLSAILSNAQAASRLLGGKSPDLAQVRECLTDIVADDKRAGEVIRRLRGLLKRGVFQPSLVDLNEVVSDAIRLLGNDAMLRNVSVKVTSHGRRHTRPPHSTFYSQGS